MGRRNMMQDGVF